LVSEEIDLIVEGRDRRVVAIETKLSPSVDDSDVAHLHWLRRTGGDLIADAIVVNTGKYAYRRSDGIGVVPASLLGPEFVETRPSSTPTTERTSARGNYRAGRFRIQAREQDG
jgi:hypothetical protein